MKDHEPSHGASQARSETREGLRGFPDLQSELDPQRGKAAKQSRLPDQTIAFVQQAFATGADDRLDERLRIFLAHAVTKSCLTLQELAPFVGVGTKARANQLFKKGILRLWQGSPKELQERYPLVSLLQNNRIRKGVPLSPEHRAQISTAERHSAESRAEIREATLKGEVQQSEARKRKPLSAESRAQMSEAKKGKSLSPEVRERLSDAHRGKQLSSEHRDAIRKGLERWKQRQKEQ